MDSLLIMTVNPGFGGQAFITEMLPKIQQAAAWRRKCGLNYRIAVDGGVDFKTARKCASAGADTFISGTSLFEHKTTSRRRWPKCEKPRNPMPPRKRSPCNEFNHH